MNKKYVFLPLLLLLPFLSFATEKSFASGPAAEYLCELGAAFYSMGRYDDALSEFNKALMVDPGSETAKKYINDIFKQNLNPLGASEPVLEKKPAVKKSPRVLSKDELIEQAMNKLENRTLEKESYSSAYNPPGREPSAVTEERGTKVGPFKISGETQLSFGVTPEEFIWKRANFNLNERFRSYRMRSDAAFDRRFNTFDPEIYDSLILNLDTKNKEGFNLHTNLTVDPWSFTGKSNKVTIPSQTGNDAAEIQLLYWSNTGYVINNTVFTLLAADTINILEVKVKKGKTDSFTVASDFFVDNFNIPSMKIKREFQPLREFWLDYSNDQAKFRLFPMGYQDQAYTSDDPLNITNHTIWWKDSKWLRMYTPGNFNPNAAPAAFVKGRWDDALSFQVKDSTGKYLTALRGLSFSFQPQEDTTLDATLATPKHLWQDYGAADNAILAARLKQYFADNFRLGVTFTHRSGFITQKSQKLDSLNFVSGVDLGYEIADGLKVQAEFLASQSKYDRSNSTYETDAKGNAYYFSLITRYPQKSIMDLRYGYDQIAKDKDESFLVKGKFYLSRMDSGFDSALSDFHNTRQDTFWSRHIHFRRPLEYFNQGLDKTTINWGELNATRIGDGIDAGRSVLGFRLELFLEDKFSNLFDLRNVHNQQRKFVENVARDEATLKLTDKLTAKGLGIYHKLPKTHRGTDPFVFDGKTGNFFTNNDVPDGVNPTIKTGSIGLNYDLFDWLSLNGIYERTNDYTLAYGDFPRNLVKTDTTLNWDFFENGNRYLTILPALADQGVFPQPPYEFYNVFKCGLRIEPLDNLEIYLDYTRNEFEAASLISDSMNHIGLEFAYMPTKKMGMHFRYTYSRSQNLENLRNGITEPLAHHNFFSEFRYLPSKDDQLVLQYGAGDYTNIGNLASMDPYGGGLLTLDTQHIIRAYYRRKF